MPSVRNEDGSWEHYFRQSDISTFRMCPEMHRVERLKLVPDRDSDTAGIGSAAHDGIKEVLDYSRQGKPIDVEQATAVALWSWCEIWENEELVRTEIGSLKEGERLIRDVMKRFMQFVYAEVLATNQVLETERQFTVPCYGDDKRTIYLQGTWDSRYEWDIQDWKTSNKWYSGRDKWKYDRHYASVQHLVYPWAAELLVVGNDPLEVEDNKEQLKHSFTYYVVPRRPTQKPKSDTPTVPMSDKLQIRPTVGDVKFLMEEMLSMALLIEAELPVWPLGPTDWWCSSKWCSNWDNCRGKHLGADPWGLLEKMNAKVIGKRNKE